MSPRAQARDDATVALRELILAGERYRIAVAARLDLSVNESRTISYLLARGAMGQTELSTALGLTTSSTTRLREVRDWLPQAFDAFDGDDLHDVAATLGTLAASLREVTTRIDTSHTSSPGRRKRH